MRCTSGKRFRQLGGVLVLVLCTPALACTNDAPGTKEDAGTSATNGSSADGTSSVTTVTTTSPSDGETSLGSSLVNSTTERGDSAATNVQTTSTQSSTGIPSSTASNVTGSLPVPEVCEDACKPKKCSGDAEYEPTCQQGCASFVQKCPAEATAFYRCGAMLESSHYACDGSNVSKISDDSCSEELQAFIPCAL